MRRTFDVVAGFLALVALAGCREPLGDQPASRVVGVAKAIASTCPPHATVVVGDEQSLAAALAAARPKDTIAISGMIRTTSEFDLTTDNLTLTCASTDAGISLVPGATVDHLLVVLSTGVTVEHLNLDSRGVNAGAYVAVFDGVGAFAANERFLRNKVICGAGSDPCVFLALNGSSIGIANDNTIRSEGALAGLHLQGVRGGSADRNVILGTAPSTNGILVNGGSTNIDVSDDTITGQWAFNVRVTEGSSSVTIQRGRFEGATEQSLRLVGTTHLQFLNNTVACEGVCFVAFGATGARISGNVFTATGAITGIDVEAGSDSDQIVNNTMIATSPTTFPGEGGIHADAGSGLLIAGNLVRGPWLNSLVLDDVANSTITGNRLEGASTNGVLFSLGESVLPIAFNKNVLQGNVITGWGNVGIFIQSACGNTVRGGSIAGNTGVRVFFDTTSGANGYFGNPSGVTDHGVFDCNGDGVADPNRVL